MIKLYYFLVTLLVYFLGASIGSFSMVVIRRGHSGKSWYTGRSVCESCGKELHWWELIPSFSYIFLHGHCSKCKSRIDPSHFIGETGLGIIFTVEFLNYMLNSSCDIQRVIVELLSLSAIWINAMSDILYQETIYSFITYIACIIVSVINGCWISTVFMIILALIIFRKDDFKYIGAGDIDMFILIYASLVTEKQDLLNRVITSIKTHLPYHEACLYVIGWEWSRVLNVLLYTGVVALLFYIIEYKKFKNKHIPFIPFIFCGYVLTLLNIGPL